MKPSPFSHLVFLICCLYLLGQHAIAQTDMMTIQLTDGSTATTSTLTSSPDQTHLSATVDPNQSTWPMEKVAKIQWSQRKPVVSQSEFLVVLVDGTKLFASTFTVKDAQATIECKNGSQLITSTRNIEWVRSNPKIDASGDTADPAWFELLKQPLESGDSLIIRRDQSLDFLEGIVGDVTSDSVAFKFGQRNADVTWDRIGGIRYYHASGRDLPKTKCLVTTTNGDQINAATLALAIKADSGDTGNSESQFELPCGVSLRIDSARLLAIDWASTTIQWLDDFKPTQVEKITYLANEKTRPLLEKLKQPSYSETIQGNPLSLVVINPETTTRQLKQYDHGVQVSGSTRMIWLFDGQFKRLRGDIGFDPRANANGYVNIKITGDRKTLFEKEMAKEDNDMVELDVDVSNIRRLTIEIDGGRNTAGDTINFCNLRATK